MGLQVTRFLGGHIQLCITNIPVVVPDLKGAGFKIRLTNTEVSGGSTSFQEWITNHSLLVGTDRLCYHYLYEDILDLGLYRSAKVQVALLFDGVIGPLIPSMDMAEVIKTSTGEYCHNQLFTDQYSLDCYMQRKLYLSMRLASHQPSISDRESPYSLRSITSVPQYGCVPDYSHV